MTRLQKLRPRLLPAAIVGMGVLLAMKAAMLVLGPAAPVVLGQAGRAVMPAARAADSEPAKPAPSRPPSTIPVEAKPLPQPATDEPAPSGAERALLLDLRARHLELEQRAGALDQREALAAATERRLSERLEQLTALQAKLEALDQTRRDRDEANWKGLVKTYETMRPRDAATIFDDLDRTVLLQVLDRMKEAKAAPILAAMQPERARLITGELAKWRSRAPAGQP